MIEFGPDGRLQRGESHSYHVRPFEGANLEPASLAVNGIDPFHPLRPAMPEKDALGRIFTEVRNAMKAQDCRRAVLVGHNAAFDLGFLNAAVARAEIKRNPFHPFSCFDTATLAGAAFGQTVLAKAAQVCGIDWDSSEAHSASYDAERTADIFCEVCNALDGVWRTRRSARADDVAISSCRSPPVPTSDAGSAKPARRRFPQCRLPGTSSTAPASLQQLLAARRCDACRARCRSRPPARRSRTAAGR